MATLQPVSVDLSSSFSGALGSQSWGGLKVSAQSFTGAASLVTKTATGLGVSGGRFAEQVDYDPATGRSELLRLDFATPLDVVTLQIGRLALNESPGKAEVGAWRAYDAAGTLVAEGLLDPRGKTALAQDTYEFTINPAVDFHRIELTARPYNNDATLGGTGPSSDFSLTKVVYVPAGTTQPQPALLVTQSGGTTAATEGGAGDSFTVALASQPAANVTVAVGGDADIAAATATLTFTPQNWNVAQTVAVSAVNDTLVEGTETAKLTLDVFSSDAGYNALPNTQVNVSVTDNDVATPAQPVTVGATAALTGALGSQSWGSLAVSARSTAGAATLVTKTVDGLGVSGGRFDGQTDYDGATRQSEALWLDFGSATDSATLRIARMNASEGGRAEVGAWRAYDAAGALVAQGLLDPRGKTAVGNYTYDFAINPAADFRRLELTARPYDNDTTLGGSGDSSDFSLAQVTYAGPGTTPPPPSVPPALTVTQSSGTTAATEGGAGDSFTVALASQPTANVTVAIGGDADVAAATATLTFTPQNWNVAQTVAVNAVNDTLVEGTETAKLTLDVSSGDAGYNALPNALVNVTVTDNDGGGTGSPPPGAVVVKVGANIQALVNANPNGTVFWIEAGEHRLQSITPKSGQSFIGEEGAVLNGSRELSGFTASGNTWYVGGQTQEGARRLLDHAQTARGGYPDAVFLDDKPLTHVGSLQEVRSGTFFFDYAADRIYIGDNPAGHQVEAAVSDFAFKGSATGVTIKNLVIEKYATPAQSGTIGATTKTQDWLIQDNEVRLNYGVGIQAGTGSEVINNYVHDNGQMGVGATGNGILYEDNEIASNGFWAGIDVYWEGGGSKFAWTQNLVVRDNYVHDNKGMGLWTDIDNIYTVYEGNRIENNSGSGINHEISYDAVIRNNTLVGNGFGFDVWLWGGNIQIQNSSNVEVYGNFVDMTNGGNGITLIQQSRGTGGYGPRVTEDNYVHDNVVVSRSGEGRSGAVADYNWTQMKAGGNVFDSNEYRVTSAAEDHFAYGGWYGWDAYRVQSGWDTNGEIVLI